MRFELSGAARRQVERIHAWWTSNRPEARSRFLDDLARAELLLRDNPEAGIAFKAHRSGVIVLKVHGATRGQSPKF